MKTILVPLDGSAIAEQVLPHVRLLAPIMAARVRLIRVVSDEDIARVRAHDGDMEHQLGSQTQIGPVNSQRVGDLLRQHAADYLAARAAELRETGADVEELVREGSPAEQIIAVAEHEEDTLIAMATHGYGGLRRWAMGSVADKVLHAATTPVFLVRATEAAPAGALALRRILVPLDGSALSEQALPLAIKLAHDTQAELVVLQVVIPLSAEAHGLSPFARLLPPWIAFPDEQREQVHQQLATTIDRFRAHDTRITPVVVFGLPAEEIVDEAVRHHVDLIVMTTHGYSGLRRWALGSVADKVLHGSTVPLLLVRAQPSQAGV